MSIKIIVKNKRASFDFALLEKWEAGLELKGTEVKSLRLGKGKIDDAFITITDDLEAWIYNFTIAHYDHGNQFNHEETRKRKLLLHKSEITEMKKRMQREHLSLIPTLLYFKQSRVKLELALGKGKNLHDKRESEKSREVERKLQQGRYDD